MTTSTEIWVTRVIDATAHDLYTETTPGDDYHEAWEQVFHSLETYLIERKSTKEEQK